MSRPGAPRGVGNCYEGRSTPVTGRLGFLGPAGTYSEEAAAIYDRGMQRVMYSTIGQVTEAAESGQVDQAIVPVENSLHGAIPEVLDFLIRSPRIKITNELALRIRNCLMVKPGTRPQQIKRIYSHPQPLGQCHRVPHHALSRRRACRSSFDGRRGHRHARQRDSCRCDCACAEQRSTGPRS